MASKTSGVTTYTEERPWGYFERFCDNHPVTGKILHLKPHESLSLQYHRQRQEFWKVLAGDACIVVGKETLLGKEHDEFFIPAGTEHRIMANGSGIRVLEISYGHFDEHDEVRLEDKYHRA